MAGATVNTTEVEAVVNTTEVFGVVRRDAGAPSNVPIVTSDLLATTPLQVAQGTDVLVGNNDATVSIPKADTNTDGYLSSTDWNTFNNKPSNLDGVVILNPGTPTRNDITPQNNTDVAARVKETTIGSSQILFALANQRFLSVWNDIVTMSADGVLQVGQPSGIAIGGIVPNGKIKLGKAGGANGGILTIETASGSGTSYTIRLPAAAPPSNTSILLSDMSGTCTWVDISASLSVPFTATCDYNDNGTGYIGISGHYNQADIAGGSDSTVSSLVARAGTLSQFYVNLTAAPGGGKSLAFKIYVNGAGTNIGFTISGANTTGSDLVNTAAVVAGDRVDIEMIETGNVAIGIRAGILLI